MKLKQSICKKAMRPPLDTTVTLSDNNTILKLYRFGGVFLEGNAKEAAMLFAKYVLEDNPRADFTTINSTLKVKTKLGEDYTIQWVNSKYNEPYWWNEFKT